MTVDIKAPHICTEFRTKNTSGEMNGKLPTMQEMAVQHEVAVATDPYPLDSDNGPAATAEGAACIPGPGCGIECVIMLLILLSLYYPQAWKRLLLKGDCYEL